MKGFWLSDLADDFALLRVWTSGWDSLRFCSTMSSKGWRVKSQDRLLVPIIHITKKSLHWEVKGFYLSDLAGTRTQDHLLKREMLYQLSYQVIRKTSKPGFFVFWGCKNRFFGNSTQPAQRNFKAFFRRWDVAWFHALQLSVRIWAFADWNHQSTPIHSIPNEGRFG